MFFKVTPEELEEVKREIKAQMTYYNHQWNLKRMTPVEYRALKKSPVQLSDPYLDKLR